MSMNKPLLGGRDRVGIGQLGGVQHLESLLERRAEILLVGEYARHHENSDRSTHRAAAGASSTCATVGGLKLPARIPRA